MAGSPLIEDDGIGLDQLAGHVSGLALLLFALQLVYQIDGVVEFNSLGYLSRYGWNRGPEHGQPLNLFLGVNINDVAARRHRHRTIRLNVFVCLSRMANADTLAADRQRDRWVRVEDKTKCGLEGGPEFCDIMRSNTEPPE